MTDIRGIRDPFIAEMVKLASLLDARMQYATPTDTSATTVPPSALPGATPSLDSGNAFANFLGGSAPAPSTGATPGAPTGNQINTPGAAVSPYYYAQIVLPLKVTIGSVFAQLLGLSPGVHTGQEIMQAYFDMPLSNAVQLQELLNNAGYYAKASNGIPLQRQQAGDLHSAAGQDAMGLAILDASNQQGDMSQIVAQAAASGIGTMQNAQALPTVTGGGNTYQVNQISGDTAYSALTSAFESSLGRAPTQKELNDFISSYNAKITSYQQAQNTQKEQMSQQVYQAQVTSRARTHGMNVVPPAGGIPAASDPYSAAAAILQVMGLAPTGENITVVAALINATGGFNAKSTSILGVSPPNATPASLIETAANLISSGKYEELNLALGANKALSMMSDPTVQSEMTQLTGGKKVKALTKVDPEAVKAQPANPAPPVETARSSGAEGGGPSQAPGGQTRQQNPNFMGPLPSGPTSTPNPAVAATLHAGATNPAVGNYLTAMANANAPTPLAQTIPGQQLTSPGDFYLPSSTLNEVTPPTPQEYATTVSQTGANRVPYLGNQFLQAYQSIINAMEAPIKT